MREKMKKCAICGNDIVSGAKVCSNCGAKNKKPIYKNPLFIVVVVFIIVIGSVAGISDAGDNSNSKNNIETKSDNYVETLADKYSGECGISASAEMGSSIIDMPELEISITNISNKDIVAVQFYAVPCDVYGEEIKGWTRQDKLYTDNTISVGASDTLTYQFIEASVKTVKLYLYSVYFSDGTEWGNRNATTSEIIKNGKLIEVYGES